MKKAAGLDGDGGGRNGQGGRAGRGRGGASPKSGLVRLGPKVNYTAPFMNVVQPLEVMADSALAASSARVGGAGGGGLGGGLGVGRGQRGRRRQGGGGTGEEGGGGDALSPLRPTIPVMLGVNADEGLMFVHAAFPLTMPKVFSALRACLPGINNCVVLLCGMQVVSKTEADFWRGCCKCVPPWWCPKKKSCVRVHGYYMPDIFFFLCFIFFVCVCFETAVFAAKLVLFWRSLLPTLKVLPGGYCCLLCC